MRAVEKQMGRRSSHTADELRELILDSATRIIDEDGLAGLSARAIARRIGYSPGTLYNVFNDLDHLVLTIEERLLESLAQRLSHVPGSDNPVQHLCDLAAAYLAFTQEKPRLWNLLFEHHMPNGWVAPPKFEAKLEALLSDLETACVPLVDRGDSKRIKRVARVLWAAVHGITSLATAEKLSNVTPADAGVMVDDLVRTYASGLMIRNQNQKPELPKRRPRA